MYLPSKIPKFHFVFSRSIFFSRRQFIYEFPAVKCNQVDLNCYSGDQIVRIQVPFQTLVAMNVINRQVIIQINKFPLIDLRKCNEKFGLVPIEKDYSEDNCLWVDAVQNSLLHKVSSNSLGRYYLFKKKRLLKYFQL